MRVSYNWLKEYANFTFSPEELAERLTMAGVPVEGVEFLGEEIDKVVVGKINKIFPHPDADKLIICMVDIGEEKELQIVTGANNVREGDKVPVALHGSTLPNGVKIKRGKLRGQISEGMLCSAKELSLDPNTISASQREGIFILPMEAEVGQDIKETLGLEDAILNLELTPNRADCFSHIGVAREIAAIKGTGERACRQSFVLKEDAEKTAENIHVNVLARENCYRYMARVIKDVKVGPSPLWLQNRLRAIGVRSINNVVDVTNYIMFELGQPLHAFDLSKIKGNVINVRQAREGELIVTLDQVERKLTPEMMVIADAKEPIAIAGVMGGLYSEVTESTVDILLECAWFNGGNVRKTAQALALRTEASNRYEKGIDPDGMEYAVDRAAYLINLLAGGRILAGRTDVVTKKEEPVRIKFEPEKINAFLGIDLSKEEIANILLNLEFEVNGDEVVVPSFRRDIIRREDLAEEIARLYGYDRIPSTLPKGVITQGKQPERGEWEEKCKEVLLDAGFYETITFSFINQKVWDNLLLPSGHPWRRNVELVNPLSEEYAVMRTTMLPSLLTVVEHNINRQNRDLKFFEIARIYLDAAEKSLNNEPVKLAAIITSDNPGTWISKGDMLFYSAKGTIENILRVMRIANYEFKPAEHPSFHQGRTAQLEIDGKVVGILGEVHPQVADAFSINQRVVFFELDMLMLTEKSNNQLLYTALPKFPAITRDLAFIAKDEVSAMQVLKIIEENGQGLVDKVELFDVYKGAQIPAGYKSMAYSLTFRAPDRTLTDAEVEEVTSQIKEQLKAVLAVELRK